MSGAADVDVGGSLVALRSFGPMGRLAIEPTRRARVGNMLPVTAGWVAGSSSRPRRGQLRLGDMTGAC